MTLQEEVKDLVAELRQVGAIWLNDKQLTKLERLIEITEKLLKGTK